MRALLVTVLAACGGAEAMTLPPPPAAVDKAASNVGLVPGESMAFEVHLAGLLAGEAQLAVGAAGEYQGHRAVVVKSRAQTAGAVALLKHIVDEATTTIDLETGRPLALETLVEQGDSQITASATFTGSVAAVTYTKRGEPAPKTIKLDFGKVTVHDAHSAMAQLRGWRAPPGAVRTVYIVGGRRLWRVDVTFAGSEVIGSALGTRRVVRYEGKSYRVTGRLAVEPKPARTFTVWLSDDADRVPLKVTAKTELGDIAMDLTEYNRP
jgi:hypothetical protein